MRHAGRPLPKLTAPRTEKERAFGSTCKGTGCHAGLPDGRPHHIPPGLLWCGLLAFARQWVREVCSPDLSMMFDHADAAEERSAKLEARIAELETGAGGSGTDSQLAESLEAAWQRIEQVEANAQIRSDRLSAQLQGILSHSRQASVASRRESHEPQP